MFHYIFHLTVYSSYALSHFIYALLSNRCPKIRQEIQSFKNRMLRIINISSEEALAKYKVKSIDELLEEHSVRILKRILANYIHPITAKIPMAKGRDNKFKPVISRANTEQYKQSFVQRNLRVRFRFWFRFYLFKTIICNLLRG